MAKTPSSEYGCSKPLAFKKPMSTTNLAPPTCHNENISRLRRRSVHVMLWVLTRYLAQTVRTSGNMVLEPLHVCHELVIVGEIQVSTLCFPGAHWWSRWKCHAILLERKADPDPYLIPDGSIQRWSSRRPGGNGSFKWMQRGLHT